MADTKDKDKQVASSAGDATAENVARWDKHVWRAGKAITLIAASTRTIKLASTITKGSVMPVHEELLCYYSEYYRAACKGEFQEAGKDSFEVELDGDALHVIGSWLYTGTIQFFDPSKSLALCMVYLFGDFIDSPALRRSCMTQIQKLGFVDGTRRLWHYHSIKRIYSGSPESSPLRRYTLDMFTTHFNPDYMPSFSVHKDDAPQEFLYELMCRCAKRSSKPSENNCSCCHDFCKYHDHETQGGEKSDLW